MNDSILTPHYTPTAKIQAALDVVDNQRWLFTNMLLMPKHQAWMHRDVRAERAAGTTSIEGVGLSKADLEELLRRGTTTRTDEAERANLNAIEAYDFIDYLSDQKDIPLDELVIRQLNREFLRGESEMLTPGVYRKGQNTVGHFVPPDQGDVPALMREFTNWLRLDHEDVHPIVKAAIAHIHLVAIHPFWDGNGRTARGLATLVLQRSDFHFGKLLSLESYFARIKDAYFTAIERTLETEFRRDYDTTNWVDFFVTGLWGEALRLTTKLTAWHRMMADMHSAFSEIKLAPRQLDGLAYAMQVGRIRRRDYIEITGVSEVTASRDLATITKAGFLRAEGRTKNRTYVFEPPKPAKEKTIPPEQARMVL